MVCPPYCGKTKRGRGLPVGAIWSAIPADFKRQLGIQLAKDFTTRVVLPVAGMVGAKKLHKHLKRKRK